MKRTTLTPTQSAWLAETFRRNAALYGGMQMKEGDEGAEGGGDEGAGKESEQSAKKGAGADDAGKAKDGDEPLGAAGKKALETERAEVKKLRSELDGFKSALGEALGIKPDDETNQQADLLASVQEQIAGMQRDAAVLKLANTHRITDEDDLELLKSATDDEAMKRLAERLAPTADESDEQSKKRRPKPDPSQGGGNAGGADNSGVSHGRNLYTASRGKAS